MNDKIFGSEFRKRILFIIIAGFFFILVFQLFSMQILEKPEFVEKSNDNSVKRILQDAPRGIFFDRNHNILVSNKPSFTLQITPSEYDKSLNRVLETVLGVDSGYINKILQENRIYSKYLPISIMRDVDFNAISWYEENSEYLKGVSYEVETQRDYSFGISASHVFGYIKEISAGQYQKNKGKYDIGDFIGFSGIEKTYNDYLRGIKGEKYIVVDSKQETIGRYQDGQQDKIAEKGYDLVLSIDAKTQKIAEEDFKNKRGALVALDPKTGEIIAFVSAPQFDLSQFGTVTSRDYWSELNSDEDKPLFNRATMSIYSPGSTFKMISAIAALENGVITPETKLLCVGGYQFGNRFFKCLHHHGRIGVEEAIEKSCNAFFYQLILKIGLKRWANYSRMFGFGQKTGLDISEETAGLVPDSNYYNKTLGKGNWTEGQLISLGIGQGELSTTPIQMAKYIGLIANNGVSVQPHFVRGVVRNEDDAYIPMDYNKVDLNISQHTFDIVKEGLYKVVNGEGTATNIRMKDIKIAGKTGTAQNPFGEDHAIFVGFAPFEDPQIVVAVIVENAGYGSTHAAPIAQDVIKTFLEGKRSKKSENNRTFTELTKDRAKKVEDKL